MDEARSQHDPGPRGVIYRTKQVILVWMVMLVMLFLLICSRGV